MAPRRKPKTVRAAVDVGDELETLRAIARALSDDIDSPDTRPTARAEASRQLRDTLDKIRVLAPPAATKDHLDDLTARRSRRRRSAA